MKIRLLLTAVACLLGIAAITYSVNAQATAITPPPTIPGTQHPIAKYRHPAIHAAIGALERAKAEMQAAAHDFGGHRVDAIAACDTAIAQLKLALQYANRTTPTTPTTQ